MAVLIHGGNASEMLILFRADNGNEAADNLTLVIYLVILSTSLLIFEPYLVINNDNSVIINDNYVNY